MFSSFSDSILLSPVRGIINDLMIRKYNGTFYKEYKCTTSIGKSNEIATDSQ